MFRGQQEQRPWHRSDEVLDGPLGSNYAWHLATVTKVWGLAYFGLALCLLHLVFAQSR